jgi:hypothetical protein
MRLHLIAVAALVLASSSAVAFHKEGHIAFPGEPSGKFVLFTIAAGATCTALIEEPEGVDAVAHGGPKKFGFIGEEEIELVVVAEDPDAVQFCFVDGLARAADVAVRVSFEAEEAAAEE